MANGLQIFHVVREPWIIAFSQKNNRRYFFNTEKNQQHWGENFAKLQETAVNFPLMFKERQIWEFKNAEEFFNSKTEFRQLNENQQIPFDAFLQFCAEKNPAKKIKN